MKKAKKTDIIIICVLAALLAIALASSLLPAIREEASIPEVTDYRYFNGKKIGILTGTNMEQASFSYFPDSEYLYFDGYPNMNIALLNGKIDAYLGDEPALKSIHAAEPGIDYMRERLTNNSYSFAFRKNDPAEKALLNEFNEFLAKIKTDGTYDEIDRIWFGTDEEKKTVDMSGLTGENGVIRVVTTSTDEPFSYIKDGKNVGYDIDVAVRFCREYGYAIEIGEVDFSARIAALASGKYEFTTTMNVTPEREEEMLFSDPVSEGGTVVAARSADLGTASRDGRSFSERIADSFRKNFIREERWRLILRGVETTCLITVLSVLFGTVMAFGICMFRRTGSRLANGISDLFVKLLQGTPTVVLLMLLYFVVFAKTSLSAVTVAIIGFALNFAAYGSEIIRSGIEGIDPGQREAALALGFSEGQSFFRFIFPQAAQLFLPVYRGEAVSLLKATSIVGYISVLDLTKMSDIIRARTYEAFYPLIVTAVIYFILAWIISLIIACILKAIEPKRHGALTVGEAA
ncbi:MAG: ABC transporter permease subunit [Oscillospiraceae bacterium]|nr:ABC transporter permease subunit [Oscillospiraceae bacterium]